MVIIVGGVFLLILNAFLTIWAGRTFFWQPYPKKPKFNKKPLIFLYDTPEGPVYKQPVEGCLMHDSDEMCDWYGIDGCRY